MYFNPEITLSIKSLSGLKKYSTCVISYLVKTDSNVEGAPFFKIHDRVTILWSDGELEEIDVAWATAADIRVLFNPWIPI